MPQTVTISEFKAKCLALVNLVGKTGQLLIITKKGEPIAQVGPTPEPPTPASWFGCMQGTGTVVGDIVSPAADENQWEVFRD